MREADRNRLVACRACGNRVARDVRRCPACGTREPAAAEASAAASTPRDDAGAMPPAAEGGGAPHAPRPFPRPPAGESLFTPPTRQPAAASPPRRAVRRRRRALVATLLVVLALTAAGAGALYLSAPIEAPPLPRRPEAAAPALDVPAAPPASASAAPPSRSRGRSEWPFFFEPGDWLTRMTDDGLLGVVVRVETSHAFADGSHGPAYAVQSMDGEERIVDADELERTARLR